jgi:hypothetical protein
VPRRPWREGDRAFKLAYVTSEGGTHTMDKHDEFAQARQEFLSAALEVAEERGDPTARVFLEWVAEKLGVDLAGGTLPVLLERYAEMVDYYSATEDVTDVRPSEGSFRLTERGVAAARGDEG